MAAFPAIDDPRIRSRYDSNVSDVDSDSVSDDDGERATSHRLYIICLAAEKRVRVRLAAGLPSEAFATATACAEALRLAKILMQPLDVSVEQQGVRRSASPLVAFPTHS